MRISNGTCIAETGSSTKNEVCYEFDKEQQVLIKCMTGELPKIISKQNYLWRDLGAEDELYARAIFMGEGCWEKLERISEETAKCILAEWEAMEDPCLDAQAMEDFVLKGNIFYTKNKDELIMVPAGYLVCLKGKSAGVYTALPETFASLPLIDYGDKLILPGMVDLHIHTPPLDTPPLDKVDLSEKIGLLELVLIHDEYEAFVNACINSATTRVVIYANPQTPLLEILVGMLEEAGFVVYVQHEGTDHVITEYPGDPDSDKMLKVHFTGTTDEDLQFMKENDVFVAHCLDFDKKNCFFGFAETRTYLDRGIHVGFGSENVVDGGQSILRAMNNAIHGSDLYRKKNDRIAAISFSEAFYMATKGGGKFFGCVGSFEDGYEFDAVVIDDSIWEHLAVTLEQRIKRTVYVTLDEDGIVAKYIRGRQILLQQSCCPE